jgi:hypothetical protein
VKLASNFLTHTLDKTLLLLRFLLDERLSADSSIYVGRRRKNLEGRESKLMPNPRERK